MNVKVVSLIPLPRSNEGKNKALMTRMAAKSYALLGETETYSGRFELQ